MLLNTIRVKFFPTPQQRALSDYYADGGDYELRYHYDLNEDSVVLDLGGYKGQWTSDIFSRYCCNIYVFEPVASFAERIQNRFVRNKKIIVMPFGLGGSSQKATISVVEDGSSLFRDSSDREEVEIVDIATWIRSKGITRIDLMKVNIEGAEYDLLERLIETDLIRIVTNLQVQFHEISPDSKIRMERIQDHLRKTHFPTYQYTFIWENWAIKYKS